MREVSTSILYTQEHWEALLRVIIERIGPAAFLEHSAYALEEEGYHVLAEHMRAAIHADRPDDRT